MKNTINTMPDNKLLQAFNKLEHAMTKEALIHDDSIYFDAISKNFESCVEYAWKYLKRLVEAQGLEAYSPKEAIKLAGKIHVIQDVELWLDFLNDRNLAVHDYIGIDDETYILTIKKFISEMKTVLTKKIT